MLKKIFSNQKGLTFIELMIAIAIIVIISAISVVYIKGTVKDEVERATDQWAADIRYTRNLAVSRTVFDFATFSTNPSVIALGEIYPPGGYGISIDKPAGLYKIFVDSGIDGSDIDSSALGYDTDTDPVIKTETLTNSLIKFGDLNNTSANNNYFSFKSENSLDTNLVLSAYGKYQVEVDYKPAYPAKGYRGILSIGELSTDGYILLNLGKSLQEYTQPAPPPGNKVDPVMQLI
ncbi:MAG: prepilin-type N-terminal cleavage/methylation domain-containing protein [Patescibacteria group bacterium]|jgi:prepilin-type N-terminal cleavage/methylation domain-containing protein